MAIQVSQEELKKQLRKDTEKVQFDRRGVSVKCPRWDRGIGFIDCQRCAYYRGYEGFTIYCKYAYIVGLPKEVKGAKHK